MEICLDLAPDELADLAKNGQWSALGAVVRRVAQYRESKRLAFADERQRWLLEDLEDRRLLAREERGNG